ncbi:MAG: SUMF1/EgtB/PvdO family nonheme iron enzyme, partial [Verrucomicrobia bacterium]|nr:SUMF1/EgtB/PvdO family nonheme iron enzyme [Verrucomicrobiota bacterium]
MAFLIRRLKVFLSVLAALVICRQTVQAGNLCGDMVRIPAGAFKMGDALGLGGEDEKPVHTPRLSEFWMDRCEISNDDMREVMQWAYDQNRIHIATNGVFNTQGAVRELLDSDDWNAEIRFSDGVFSVAAGRENFPCVEVTWFGALAFTNFRSLQEGLDPCIDFNDWT